jgi:TolA-binding protein
MALSNAEKQAAWRARRNELARETESTAAKLKEARQEIRRLRKRIAELEGGARNRTTRGRVAP